MRSLAIAPLVVFATACTAFSSAGPARFQEPATRAASLMKASAPPIRFELDLAAESIADIRPLGQSLLLELMAEESDDAGLAAARACGELVLLDPQAGKPLWTRKRQGLCANGVAVRERTIVTFETRRIQKASKTILTELDASTGSVLKSSEGGAAMALAVGSDVYVLEEADKNQNVVSYGEGLARKWSTSVTAVKPRDLALVGDTLFAYGDSIVAIDVKSGRASNPVMEPSPNGLSVLPHADGLFINRVDAGGSPQLIAIGRDGVTRWKADGQAALVADATGLVVATGNEIAYVGIQDGKERWRAKTNGRITGRPVVSSAPEPLVLVPQASALTAFALATGDVRWTVAARAGEPPVRYTDHVIVGSDITVWDTWRHVVGIDATGAVRYDLDVRSLPDAHRESSAIRAGLAPALGASQTLDMSAVTSLLHTPMGDGTTVSTSNVSMGLTSATAQMALGAIEHQAAVQQGNFDMMIRAAAARSRAMFQMTQRYASMSALEDYLIRPIAWNLGRGFLLVRKSDGAFTEIVTGPSDFFEGPFREPSIAGFHIGAKVLVTFSEGLAPERWTPKTRLPVEVVKRRLVGYELDPASFKAPETYAQSSLVPQGSFLWTGEHAK